MARLAKRPNDTEQLEAAKASVLAALNRRRDRRRTEGHPIVIDYRGYWLAVAPAEHAEYRGFRRRTGLSHLAAESDDLTERPRRGPP